MTAGGRKQHITNPARQDLALPCIRRNFKPLQLANYFQQSALTNQLRVQHGLNALASYGPLVSIGRMWSGNMACWSDRR